MSLSVCVGGIESTPTESKLKTKRHIFIILLSCVIKTKQKVRYTNLTGVGFTTTDLSCPRADVGLPVAVFGDEVGDLSRAPVGAGFPFADDRLDGTCGGMCFMKGCGYPPRSLPLYFEIHV